MTIPEAGGLPLPLPRGGLFQNAAWSQCRIWSWIAVLILALVGQAAGTFTPHVDADGRVSLPRDFRGHMVHLGSWFVPAGEASGFHDVYTEPATVAAFRACPSRTRPRSTWRAPTGRSSRLPPPGQGDGPGLPARLPDPGPGPLTAAPGFALIFGRLGRTSDSNMINQSEMPRC